MVQLLKVLKQFPNALVKYKVVYLDESGTSLDDYYDDLKKASDVFISLMEMDYDVQLYHTVVLDLKENGYRELDSEIIDTHCPVEV